MPMHILQRLGLRMGLGMLMALIFLSLTTSSCYAGKKQTDADKKNTITNMYINYKKKYFPNVVDITPQEAMALANQGRVVFVDIRKPMEIKVSKLKGAISQEDFLADPSKYEGKTIVGYCTISFRSGRLAKEQSRKGIAMLNLKGGILAWVHEGGKVYDRKGETHRLHVYSKRWDLAPEGYETVKFSWRDKLF